jgi:hypothetical protein
MSGKFGSFWTFGVLLDGSTSEHAVTAWKIDSEPTDLQRRECD